jgi:hypothetical protein
MTNSFYVHSTGRITNASRILNYFDNAENGFISAFRLHLIMTTTLEISRLSDHLLI